MEHYPAECSLELRFVGVLFNPSKWENGTRTENHVEALSVTFRLKEIEFPSLWILRRRTIRKQTRIQGTDPESMSEVRPCGGSWILPSRSDQNLIVLHQLNFESSQESRKYVMLLIAALEKKPRAPEKLPSGEPRILLALR